MFGLGVHELMIVGIVAVLLFGRKLPEVARSLGSSYREFRKGLNEFQATVNDPYPSSRSSYSSSSYSSTPALSSTTHDDYADTATAPKFEPPAAEPQAETLSSSEPEQPSTAAGEAAPDKRYEGSSYT